MDKFVERIDAAGSTISVSREFVLDVPAKGERDDAFFEKAHEVTEEKTKSIRDACPLAGDCALRASCDFRREIIGLGEASIEYSTRITINDNNPECPNPNAFQEVVKAILPE